MLVRRVDHLQVGSTRHLLQFSRATCMGFMRHSHSVENMLIPLSFYYREMNQLMSIGTHCNQQGLAITIYM
jgi:hypothetical protein